MLWTGLTIFWFYICTTFLNIPPISSFHLSDVGIENHNSWLPPTPSHSWKDTRNFRESVEGGFQCFFFPLRQCSCKRSGGSGRFLPWFNAPKDAHLFEGVWYVHQEPRQPANAQVLGFQMGISPSIHPHWGHIFLFNVSIFFLCLKLAAHFLCWNVCRRKGYQNITEIQVRGFHYLYLSYTGPHRWLIFEWLVLFLFIFCVGRQRWKADRAEIGKVDRIIISHISRFSLSSTKLAIRKPCGARKETWQFSFPDDPERMWHTGKPSK